MDNSESALFKGLRNTVKEYKMKFQFNVITNDEDYLEYNKFWMLRSHYGKKQMLSFRIIFTVLLCLIILAYLFIGGFTVQSLISAIPMAILLVLFEVLLTPLFVVSLKSHIKGLKKKGKMAYSPSAVLEFFENSFVETTPTNKTEQYYTSIERISVVDNKVVYIHVNNIMSYILPFSCFSSKEECDSFFAFIRTKCQNIDIY